MEKEEIKAKIEALKETLTGDMVQDMETKDKIHNLEMKLKGTKPTDSHFDCIGCGS
jgi:phage-related minor tail protein